jgi:hypothetical protein
MACLQRCLYIIKIYTSKLQSGLLKGHAFSHHYSLIFLSGFIFNMGDDTIDKPVY